MDKQGSDNQGSTLLDMMLTLQLLSGMYYLVSEMVYVFKLCIGAQEFTVLLLYCWLPVLNDVS